MTELESAKNSGNPTTIILGTVSHGAIGFILGSALPLLLKPGSNLGPLLGIIGIGPFGLIWGLVLGMILTLFRCEPKSQIVWMCLSLAGFTGLTFFLSFSQEKLGVFILDGEILKCISQDSLEFENLMSQRIEWWESGLNSESHASDWGKRVRSRIKPDPGVVFQILIHRETNQTPNEPDQIKHLQWQDVQRKEWVFCRIHDMECEADLIGKRSLFTLTWESSRLSPPDTLPAFLGLKVLKPVPESLNQEKTLLNQLDVKTGGQQAIDSCNYCGWIVS